MEEKKKNPEKKEGKQFSEKPMPAKKSEATMISKLLNLVVWLTGVIVSLSVGFGMIGRTLSLPFWLGGDIVAMIAGWVVVITTLSGVVLAILNR
ncbi:MAG: hypothetical protein ACOC1P_03405 [Minisyncoccales bacterium]